MSQPPPSRTLIAWLVIFALVFISVSVTGILVGKLNNKEHDEEEGLSLYPDSVELVTYVRQYGMNEEVQMALEADMALGEFLAFSSDTSVQDQFFSFLLWNARAAMKTTPKVRQAVLTSDIPAISNWRGQAIARMNASASEIMQAANADDLDEAGLALLLASTGRSYSLRAEDITEEHGIDDLLVFAAASPVDSRAAMAEMIVDQNGRPVEIPNSVSVYDWLHERRLVLAVESFGSGYRFRVEDAGVDVENRPEGGR